MRFRLGVASGRCVLLVLCLGTSVSSVRSAGVSTPPPFGDDAAGLPNSTSPTPRPFPAPLPSSSPIPPPQTSSAPEPPKLVDAEDLFVGSRKYANRLIMIKGMRCYYADAEDYRCIAPSGLLLAVFTGSVEPISARVWLETKCDQFKIAMTNSACVFNPSFVYTPDDVEEDVVSGFNKRKVIRPPSGVTMISPRKVDDSDPPTRRRR